MLQTLDEKRDERVRAWADAHGEYPTLVLGHRDDRGTYRCLDHQSSKRRREVVMAGDRNGELASCCVCGRHLRAAEAFGGLDESNLMA